MLLTASVLARPVSDAFEDRVQGTLDSPRVASGFLGATAAVTWRDGTLRAFPAGAGYHYSDTNYILAGLIVEDVTGREYYDVRHRRLLGPLGLTLTAPADRRDLPGSGARYVKGEKFYATPQTASATP